MRDLAVDSGLGSLRPSNEWSSGALLVGLVPSSSSMETVFDLFGLFGGVIGLEPDGEAVFYSSAIPGLMRGRASTSPSRVKAFVGDDDFLGMSGASWAGVQASLSLWPKHDGESVLSVRVWESGRGSGPGLVGPLVGAVERAAKSMRVLAGAVDSSDKFDPFYDELWPRPRLGCQDEWYEQFVPGYFPRLYLASCLTEGLGDPDQRLLRSSLVDGSGAVVTAVAVDAAPDDDAALWEGVRLVREWVRPRLPGWLWIQPRKIVRPRTFEGPPVPRYFADVAKRVALDGWSRADATDPLERVYRSLDTSALGAGFGDTRWRVEVDPPKYVDKTVEAIESILLACDFTAADGWVAGADGLSFTAPVVSGTTIEWETSLKPGSAQLSDLMFAGFAGIKDGFTVPSPTGDVCPVVKITGEDC